MKCPNCKNSETKKADNYCIICAHRLYPNVPVASKLLWIVRNLPFKKGADNRGKYLWVNGMTFEYGSLGKWHTLDDAINAAYTWVKIHYKEENEK